MSNEATVQAEVAQKFPALAEGIKIPRPRRVFVRVPQEMFREVFDYLYDVQKFVMLPAITGVDEGETLGAMYHMAADTGVVLTLITSVPKTQPVIQTVTDRFPAAEVYERELVDLLGFQVQGLPPGSRYPLPDNWPAGQYPLRKDFKAETFIASQEGGAQ